MKNLILTGIIVSALGIYAVPSFAEQATPKATSSSEAFKKFVSSDPNVQQLISQTKLNESISAACFSSGLSRHNGTTIKRDGTIYTWVMPDSDNKEIKNFVTKNQKIADEIFTSSTIRQFSSESLDYKIDGTSYCYVRINSGSAKKQISWPKNEIMAGHKKVPPAAKELFAIITNNGVALQQRSVKP